MLRMEAVPASISPNFRTIPAEECLTFDARFCQHKAHRHGGSSMESGLEHIPVTKATPCIEAIAPRTEKSIQFMIASKVILSNLSF
ncbi:hypothetical protein AVEN_23364-1 [Araneus ventricosus]|uniref:Uncharacterized protein n=1 Tax=Araneus ventricosus TaxID=182803 RepID=A0A4Y2H2J9_ARAVE|nr:hypothetical protein AVEN_23364-1 [Araneus ventricosus]